MTPGFTPYERAKSKQTRQQKRNAAVGSASSESIAHYRANRRGSNVGQNAGQKTAQTCPIPAHRALVVIEQPEATPPATIRKFLIVHPLQRRLHAHRTHQQHLNRPAQMVCSTAQPTRRALAARRNADLPAIIFTPEIALSIEESERNTASESADSLPYSTTAKNTGVALNLLQRTSFPIRLFPPVTIVNGHMAFEAFRSLPRYLEETQRNGCIEQAEYLRGQIQRYADVNSPTSGAIWFRTLVLGVVKYFVYDATDNCLIQYWGG